MSVLFVAAFIVGFIGLLIASECVIKRVERTRFGQYVDDKIIRKVLGG